MRSPLKTTTIATLALVLLSGAAFAAGHHDFGRDSDKGAYTGDYYQGIFGQDDMTTPAMPVYRTPVHMASSRLDRVLNELKVDNHRINADREQGKLTAANYRKLEREDGAVRAEALKTAAAHDGMLPARSYARLQSDVRHLDQDIARMA
ncbi:hypothetical protein [Ensifer adhaerens]|uniref:hypothetical protein n=1 Tax=Ensifer adhaerens TaxID=106592 RepID=UPI00098FEF16|nr:hypothetical protein [Ensifer adhaerens]